MLTTAQSLRYGAAWGWAIVWIALLIFVFFPILVVGFLTRGIGTMLCNCAYGLHDLLDWIGHKISGGEA